MPIDLFDWYSHSTISNYMLNHYSQTSSEPHLATKKIKKSQKSSKSFQIISPVPLIMKFHGESDSDNPRIDLYRKIIIFDEKMKSKRGSKSPYIPPFKRAI